MPPRVKIRYSAFGEEYTRADAYLMESICVVAPSQLIERSEAELISSLQGMYEKYRLKIFEGLREIDPTCKSLPEVVAFIQKVRKIAARSLDKCFRGQTYMEDMAAPTPEKQITNGWHHRNGPRVSD